MDNQHSWCIAICQQESPPAWTQEAYRPPCSEYSFCCPTRVPPPGWYPDLGTPSPQGGVPRPRYPPPPGGGYPDLGPPQGGYPDLSTPPWGGYPDLGTPPRGGTRTSVPPPWGGVRVPPRLPHGILGNVAKHYGIWVPPLWTDRLMDGQTRVKTLPSLVLRTRAVMNHHNALQLTTVQLG